MIRSKGCSWHCFLADPAWCSRHASVIHHSFFRSRSRLAEEDEVYTVFPNIGHIPGLLVTVQELLFLDHLPI
jgi:hypothetical protein